MLTPTGRPGLGCLGQGGGTSVGILGTGPRPEPLNLPPGREATGVTCNPWSIHTLGPAGITLAAPGDGCPVAFCRQIKNLRIIQLCSLVWAGHGNTLRC